MPKPRAPRLKCATARRKLAAQKKPYWRSYQPNIALGYRRNEGAGTWSVRVTGNGEPGSSASHSPTISSPPTATPC